LTFSEKRRSASPLRSTTLNACSKPPEGYARWSLRLLESKVVEFDIVEAASDSTIQRVLEKTLSSRTAANTGSSRPRPAARS
jgi:hypothetical protein